MKKTSIKLNYIYNVTYQILAIILPIITSPYISRVLGADGVGIYSYTYTIANYFVLIGVLGTNVYGQQIVAKVQDDFKLRTKYFWEIFAIRFICSIVSLLLYTIVVIAYKDYRIYLMVLLIYIISNIFDISWFFQGLEEFKSVVIRNIIIKICTIFCIFTFVNSKDDLLIYILCIVLSTLLGNLSIWFRLRGLIGRPCLDKFCIKEHFKETIVLFIPQVAYTIYGTIAKLMIGIITNSSYEVGYFEQANKIIQILITVISSLNIVMRSRISYLVGKGEKEIIKNYIQKSYKFVCMIAMPLIFGLIACAKAFVPIFFGKGYEDVIILMQLLSPIIYSIGLNNLLGIQYLTPTGKQVICNKVLIIAAIVNIFVNVILIPRFLGVGAVFASVIAETMVAIVYVALSKDVIKLRDIFKMSKRYVIVSIIMFVVIECVKLFGFTNTIELSLQFLLGVMVYFGILIFIKDELVYEFIEGIRKKL